MASRRCVLSSPQLRGRRPRLARLAGSLLLVLGLGSGSASATAIAGDPALFLDDPRLSKLSERAGDYRVQFTGFDASRFQNAEGGILGVSAEVTFHTVGAGDLLPSSGGGGAGSGPSGSFARSLLVFTSVRLGSAPAGGLSCPIPSSLALANADYVPSSFAGDLSGAALLVGDRANGKVCDSEGDLFVALPLAGPAGSAQTVDFEIRLRGPLPSLAFFLQYQAYSVVPEPAAAALLLAGVGALALARRRRLRQRPQN